MPREELQAQTLLRLSTNEDGSRRSYYDTKAPGLVLRVGGPRPQDRVWFFEFVSPSATRKRPAGTTTRGASRRMRLGCLADEPTLTDRRKEVARLRGIVAAGGDPLSERQAARRVVEGSETFAALGVRALKALKTQLRPATTDEWERIWAKHVLPAMGDVDAGDPVALKRAALKMGDRLFEEGRRYGANRCIELARRIMSFAVATDRDGRYPANPLLRVQKPLREEAVRTRLYAADEVRVIVACAADTAYEDLIPLLLATGARAGETMAAEWREVDGSTWTIPAAKSKIDHDRPVHLNRFALATLERIRERSGGGGWLFPAASKSGHLERMQKVVYQIRRVPPNDRTQWVVGVADFELHDLRRVVRSGLNELGAPTDVAELCLGHLPPKLVRVYSPHPSFWKLREQRAVMEAWGAKLEKILAGEQRTADVLPMVGARA